MASSSPLLFSLIVSLLILSYSCADESIKVINLTNPALEFTPSPVVGHSTFHEPRDFVSCARVRVAGLSRLRIGSYASAFRITLFPSVLIPDRLHDKIQVCFHGNSSLGLCECEKDDWRAFQNGIWNSIMSPYEDRYIDVKYTREVPGSVTLSVDEEFQQWRIVCLALGFVILLLAPIVSGWVPFYYSSSMAIGVLLVIIILLFQVMKLIPTGRRSFFYLAIYSSLLGAGSFLLHQFSVLVNSILVSFGLSEEMYSPVSVFILVGIVLAGAAMGYWIVRKFIISEDGSVDVGVAQFVKWAMRVIAASLIFQSTLDPYLAIVAVASCLVICILISSCDWQSLMYQLDSRKEDLWLQRRQATTGSKRAEFLSRSRKTSPGGNLWNTSKNSFAWDNSPVKGLTSQSPSTVAQDHHDYYSTFHKTPTRKRFTKKEWERFTRNSTRQAVSELASSPEFTDWIIEHADRIQLLPDESSDEAIGSGSDSTEEAAAESCNRLNFFKW
ncbi:NEMP family [Dillenia turbinata]|uniref:NEMP family n=1 Tax=Dillenia turbinata TaxID=194707 RepID=A0AAN8W7E1_9MAGN